MDVNTITSLITQQFLPYIATDNLNVTKYEETFLPVWCSMSQMQFKICNKYCWEWTLWLAIGDCLLVPQTSENSRYKTMSQSSSSSSILSMIIIIIITIIIILIITVSLCERSTEQREIVPPSNKVLLERILLLHLLLLLLHLLLLLFPLLLLWKLPHPRLSHPRATKCVPWSVYLRPKPSRLKIWADFILHVLNGVIIWPENFVG